ncbi:kynureninase [Virgibacillus halophilus]|uniref:Kynureninase n=1 Tax=Tigheibacillus halophilus TaxID=361280 RepID=A0ABU5CBU8_9BACI|nr:kynureninase [Virgibacillus halophilus]
MRKDVSQTYAAELDAQDSLQQFRDEFYVQPDKIYFDGNSLGLLSKRSEKALLDILNSWKTNGIDGWVKGENPWFYLSEKLGQKSAPLIGANSNEVIITGSTTANLHQLTATLYQPAGNKTKILADELNFPTDLYALKSQLELHGNDPKHHLIQVKSSDGQTLNEEDIIAAMTEEVAFIVLPSVLYRSGQILDMKRLTKEAHHRGIMIGFDLCHSIGAIPHALSEWNVDFAFWCTYKHLNGGPGSVAGLYINQKHFLKKPGLAGWFGSAKEKQFDLTLDMHPAVDSSAFQVGTPHMLSAAPLIGSLEIFEDAGINHIRQKSLQLTDYMMMLVDAELQMFDFSVGSPRNHEKRGGHILLRHKEAARICKALKENGVIPDFRAPDGIRLAPVALYNTFSEVWQTVRILKNIMMEKQYKQFANTRDVIA